MNARAMETLEIIAVVAAITAVAVLVFRRRGAAVLVSVPASDENIPITHAGEAGSDYWNYNYPMIQGIPFQPTVTHDQGSCGATCGCTETTLLGSNADFQRLLQTRLTGFIDAYVDNVFSFLPSWFTQYLNIVGPEMSNFPAVEL